MAVKYELTHYVYDVETPPGLGGEVLDTFLEKLLEIEGVTQYALGWDIVTIHVQTGKAISKIFAEIENIIPKG